MKKIVQIHLVLVVFLVAQVAVADLDILVPNKQVSSVLPRIHVVGYSDYPEVAISLNGKHLTKVETDGDIFHSLIHMPYGLNQISVAPVSPTGERGSVSDTFMSLVLEEAVELEVLCGPRIPRNYQKVYIPYVFHDTAQHPECLDCHSRTTSSADEDEDAEWCYECHSLIQQQFNGHVVGDENLCTNCHRLDEDLTLKRTGVYTDMNPCFLCHKDKIGEFAKDFIHGPVAGGTCVVCHNPHGSEFEANLHSPVPVLCLFCHTSIDEQTDPVQHAPFSSGYCVECHDPHATGNRWVLNRSSGVLCIDCHEKVVTGSSHRHPVDAMPKTALKKELALNDEGRLECLTCHHPHSGSAQFLLRTSGGNACLGCHPEYQ